MTFPDSPVGRIRGAAATSGSAPRRSSSGDLMLDSVWSSSPVACSALVRELRGPFVRVPARIDTDDLDLDLVVLPDGNAA